MRMIVSARLRFEDGLGMGKVLHDRRVSVPQLVKQRHNYTEVP